ncbi:unnamed protein product [Effrenium voratum]|nr:unnamed protein product [Effrenium voratum]
MSDYVQRQVLPALKDKTDIPLMKELLHRWSNHKIYVKWMDRFFTYLDRYYVKLQSVEPLHNRGYSIFNTQVFQIVIKDTRAALLKVINQERQGEHIDQDLVKGVIEIYIDLGLNNTNLYNTEFEESFLPATTSYFVRQASGWLSEDSFPEYLRKAEAALHAEEQRCHNYLSRTTLPKLKNVVIQAVLAQPQAQLLEKETGVVYLLDNDKREDLARMHRMFTLVDNGLAPIAQSFRQYVTDRGNQIVDERVEQQKSISSKAEALNDPTFIQTLLELHDRFKGIVHECFSQDSLFQKSLKEAFEVFVNRDIGKFSFAALMSSFCDRILKKSGERLSDEQVETLLTKMVELFSFLSDKDLFAEIYRNQLSKRLLYETSASEDAEKSSSARSFGTRAASAASAAFGAGALAARPSARRRLARHAASTPLEVIRFRDTAVPEVKFGFPGVDEVQVILLKGQGDDMEPIFPKEELLDNDVKEAIGEFIKAEKFEAKAGNVASFPFVSDIRVRMVLVGLGDKDVDSRFAGATAARALQALKGVQSAGVVAEGLEAASFVEGLLLGFHNDQRFQGTKTPEKDKVKGPAEVHLSFGSREDLQRGEAVATSVIFARELVNAPANFVNPPNLALAAEDLASRLGLEAKILDEKECEELGMGSFLAVSKCSDLGARLIHLTYKEGKGSRKVGIVGKGLTFDSGGYNIKCGAGCLIEMMKTDMAGSAATLGAAAALAQLKPKDVEVHFIIATTENMISGNPGSLHPGDIITAMDGTTIEVNNTDAEGRLTLADALLYCQQQGVTEVVDIATLTGAKMVGLGLEISALYSNSEDLAQRLETSAKATGEKLWRMPLEDGYFEQLKSDFADMKNAGTRWGGSITAALFLQKFIQKDMNWAHLDIAGADYAEKVKGMIAKLKMKCGAQFTSKLEGMLTDLSLALDTQKDFKEHCERLPEGKGALGGIDFNVTVLTTGFWPSYQVQEASLCPEMQKAIQVFSNYYNGKTQHRRLQWIHSLGQATIAAKLNGRRHDLIVNSYQALILLLFTRDEAHNLSFIQNSTGLEPGMCKKLLATLSIAKFKILSKTGDLKTIEDDASFAPNDSFQCQHRKIKIPPPVTEETHNKERVEEDRSIAIEAAIVRIMKMRKTLNHQQLVTEVLTQLAFFKPNPKLVKQRIEHLIEREYLERDKNQASVYRYLA